jgi:serine/threonine protein phosphatase 1
MQKRGNVTWIIGDIHGMYDPLRVLIDRLDNEWLDKFVFLGDYIDYGPSSKEVLDLIIGLGDKAICLMGNHEHLLLQSLYNEWHRDNYGYTVWKNNGAKSTLRSFGCETFEEFEQTLDQKYADFFMNLKCFHTETIACEGHELKFLITHAGVMPDVPLEEQLAVNSYQEFNQFVKDKKVWIEDAFIWIREGFLNADPSTWEPYIVIHGHTPTHLLRYYLKEPPSEELAGQIYLREHPQKEEEDQCFVSIDIDTSAAFGHRLTALGLSPTSVHPRSYPVLRLSTVQLDIRAGYYRGSPFRSHSFEIECGCGPKIDIS